MEILNTIITDHGNTSRETGDLNEWSGCVSCGGLDDDDDDDAADCDFDDDDFDDDDSKVTIYFDSSTSVGTITDIGNASETESMKTGDGLKLIEVDDDLDDNEDDKSDKSSVYDADIFDQISNCDIGAINDYDKYDTDDSKIGRIPEFIFLLTGEHKQDHEYTIEIEFEEEEIDYQNRTKSGSNNDNDDNETDACTMATKMLDVSSSTYDDDDEESFPCEDDSQYDDFAFGDDDEEEDISIINDEEEEDSMIIKVQELTSMTESMMTSSVDEKDNDDNDNGNGNGTDNDDDNDNDNGNDCLSMIDNLMEQFESDILELKSDISIQFVDTNNTTDTEQEAMTALSPTTRNICCDETFITTNTTTRIEDDVDDDVSVVADTLLEQFEVDLLELKKEMARKFGTHNADDFFSSLPPTSTTTTTTVASEASRAAPFSIIASALTTASATTTTTATTTSCETPNTTIVVLSEEDDDIDDDVDIFMDSSSYDLDKEHHNHHHPYKHSSLSISTATATATTCDQTHKTTTPIIKIDNENDSDSDMASNLSSSDPNHHDPLQTTMELCQNHRHRPYSQHPCRRTETIEECQGGALPPQRSVRRKIQDYESAEIILKRQRIINNIVNDMKLIHKNHKKMETKQPIQFISQQYIQSNRVIKSSTLS